MISTRKAAFRCRLSQSVRRRSALLKFVPLNTSLTTRAVLSVIEVTTCYIELLAPVARPFLMREKLRQPSLADEYPHGRTAGAHFAGAELPDSSRSDDPIGATRTALVEYINRIQSRSGEAKGATMRGCLGVWPHRANHPRMASKGRSLTV